MTPPKKRTLIKICKTVSTICPPNWETLYREIVLEPIQQKLKARGSIINLDNYHPPIRNLDALEEAIDLFVTKDIISIVEAALTRCNDIIQGVADLPYSNKCGL